MPAIAERLPAKYLIKDEAPKTISSPQQHEAYIFRLLELQRRAHRTAEETETAKLLIVLIADYEGKHFTIRKPSGVEVLKELMDTNGLRQRILRRIWGAKYCFPDPERKAPAEQTTDGKTQPAFSRLTGSFLLAPFDKESGRTRPDFSSDRPQALIARLRILFFIVLTQNSYAGANAFEISDLKKINMGARRPGV